MTDDEVQNLANVIWAAGETYIGPSIHTLRAFAYLVATAERERIAAEFDRRAVYHDGTPSTGWYEAQEPAEIIRRLT